MTFSSPARLCACGCGISLSDRRPQARYHTKACWDRAYRQRERAAHPHPHRDTPQYKQMRDEWPEYVGYRWVSVNHAGDI